MLRVLAGLKNRNTICNKQHSFIIGYWINNGLDFYPAFFNFIKFFIFLSHFYNHLHKKNLSLPGIDFVSIILYQDFYLACFRIYLSSITSFSLNFLLLSFSSSLSNIRSFNVLYEGRKN